MSDSPYMIGRDSDGKLVARPLSPHLQVYRLPLLAMLSILHRATGVVLTLGGFVLVWWLMAAAAAEPRHFALVQSLLGSWIGRTALLGWTFSLFYHLANGVRHLYWDTGRGYDLATAQRSGYAMLVVSAALTLAAWALGYAAR